MTEVQQTQTWTVYAPEEQRQQINDLLAVLNGLVANEAGVEGMQIPKAKLIILGLRTAIELKDPSGFRKLNV
jgi:hypothetical protein